MRDLYRVLQVDPAAEADVIAAAYRVLARKLHPDRAAREAERMIELNRAYAILRDPSSRARYDRDRALGIQQPIPVPEPDGVRYTAPTAGRLDFGRYEGWALRDIARRDPDYLRFQLQMYAACAGDDVIRERVREDFRALVDLAREISGAPEDELWRFFSTGMMLNAISSLGLPELEGDPWAELWSDPKTLLDP